MTNLSIQVWAQLNIYNWREKNNAYALTHKMLKVKNSHWVYTYVHAVQVGRALSEHG